MSKRARTGHSAPRPRPLLPRTWLLPGSLLLAAAALGSSQPARGAELIVNGNFVAEDFATASGWLVMDDKYGTAQQAPDIAVWSDTEPNYGAILRVCQNATEVGGASGGVWGAHIEQTLALQAGATYTLSFWATDLVPSVVNGDPSCGLHAGPSRSLQVQVYGQASGELLTRAVAVASCGSVCGSTHQYQFVAPENDTATLKFFFGGQWTKLKLSGVSLSESLPAPEPGASSGVSSNQLGYLPAGPKLATVRSTSAEPLPWELRDALGTALASGTALPLGADALSGDTLQRIDFGAFTGSGSDLRLVVDGVSSAPFAVANDVYAGLARDSLRFFYYQRCGQGLGLAQAEDAAWARGADHANDAVAGCSAGQTCGAGYPLSVSKGWHDAGDYGKYVITGAVSAWTLLNQYERSALWGNSASGVADGSLNTAPPNGVSDLLDEARHELEFLLGMQVPEGNPLAGMAHHKLHSDDWVPMPTHPENDASVRRLHPPSTAATLDLAAVAAQCARVWRDLDGAFAARCQSVAERAWSAALAHPDLFAPSNSNQGGGSYDDGYVGDEFYWAAAELFLSTGRGEYADILRTSSHYAGFNPSLGNGPVTWPGTAGFGTMSLALVPGALDASEVVAMRQAIVDTAEALLVLAAQNGYGVPIANVIWGSNSDALNAGIVMALAHDLTADARFLSGAASALDYVLGRNPFDRSFVTRTGATPVGRIHHTNFAPYLDAAFPQPPPGFLVGGPNADLTAFADPGVARDCSPLRCWSEASGAYWFIEVAINWNAPLAWLSSWLDERGQHPPSAPVGVGGAGSTHGPNTGGNSGAGSSGAGSSSGASGSAPGSDPALSDPTTLDSNVPGGANGTNAASGSSGCACRVSSSHDAAWPLLLGGLALAWLRRRRSAS